MNGRQRTVQIKFRVTEEERALIEQKMKLIPTDNMAAYLIPQECGNKTEVRWAKVTDNRGRGLLFGGDRMNFSALPYTPHELENAAHPFELPPVHYTVIRASAAQMGVGGDDSWGAQTHPEYLLDSV